MQLNSVLKRLGTLGPLPARGFVALLTEASLVSQVEVDKSKWVRPTGKVLIVHANGKPYGYGSQEQALKSTVDENVKEKFKDPRFLRAKVSCSPLA